MSYLVEVVNVECAECGLISNCLEGWRAFRPAPSLYWYYLCPTCAEG